jgi:hypothetical protein
MQRRGCRERLIYTVRTSPPTGPSARPQRVSFAFWWFFEDARSWAVSAAARQHSAQLPALRQQFR